MSTSIATTPVSDPVTVNGTKCRPIREGLATILAPYREAASVPTNTKGNKSRNNDEGEQAVFYNPIQQFNRDLSVLAILAYGEAALVEKAERYRKKGKQLKKQRDHAKKRKTAFETARLASANVESDHEENGTKKRKRIDDDVSEELPNEHGGENVKRIKKDDLEPDDEELEIMQMYEMGQKQPYTNGFDGSGDQIANLEFKKRGPRFTILDALSATGLRALRYAKEIPFVTRIVANDLSRDAVKSIEMNIDHNDLKGKICSNVGDARAYMYSKVGIEQSSSSSSTIHRFDVIDLDPYGTAAPFFDSALQAIQDGGLLCVTCTDAGVFASNGYPEKSYSLYGGIPTKGVHSHEGGLRLILQAIASSGAKYGIAIEPLLSLSIDFYVRLFVRIHKEQKDVKLLAGSTMLVYSCDHGCGAWTTQLLARNTAKESRIGDLYFKHSFAQGPSATPNCEHCGTKTHLSGPMWAGPLHNPYFIQRILDKLPSLDEKIYATIPRIEGMLTVAREEDLNLDQKIMTAAPTPIAATDPQTSPEPTPTLPIPRTAPSTLESHPFFVLPSSLAKVLHTQTPSESAFRGALLHLGYRVTRSHCKPGSIRTDAPWSVLWEIMREWVRTQSPIREGAVKERTAGWGILGKMRGAERSVVAKIKGQVEEMLEGCKGMGDVKVVLEAALFRLSREKEGIGEPISSNTDTQAETDQEVTETEQADKKPNHSLDPSKLNIVFDEALGKEKSTRKVCRYQPNPRPNWGPMNRAAGV
jgi:tRNA (guanine26-N2/guanine27-N2)-dimethyltransferase